MDLSVSEGLRADLGERILHYLKDKENGGMEGWRDGGMEEGRGGKEEGRGGKEERREERREGNGAN